MKLSSAVAGALVGTVAMVGATAAPSLAASSSEKPHISVVDKTITYDSGTDTASVTGTFRCQPTDHLHVWVSVKQGADVKAHASSSDADAWYDAHPGEEDPGVVPCDGAWHTVTYDITSNFGTLEEGAAWIQFCLVTGDEIVTSMSRWGTVVED